MTKRLGFSSLALTDEESAMAWYFREAGPSIAETFSEELVRTYELISASPKIGALRYARYLEIPGLRGLGLNRFPYLVLYFDRLDNIDVVRVLHIRQDTRTFMDDASE